MENVKTDYGRLYNNFAERRSAARYAFPVDVEAIEIRSNIRILARLSDISRCGCYIDTINPFSKNAVVMLTITRDNQTFKSHANVVYSKNGMGMGLAFTLTEPDQARVLEAWINELSGAPTLRVPGAPSNVAPKVTLPAPTEVVTDEGMRYVLSKLIALLNGKNVISDSEGMALLRKLNKR